MPEMEAPAANRLIARRRPIVFPRNPGALAEFELPDPHAFEVVQP
jgi:hypothetical protein